MDALLLQMAYLSIHDFECSPYSIETFRKILSQDGFSGELNDMGWLIEELTVFTKDISLDSVKSISYVFTLCVLHELHLLRHWEQQLCLGWRSPYRAMKTFSKNIDLETHNLLWDCVCGKKHIPWWFCEPQTNVVYQTVLYYLEENYMLPENWEQLYEFSAVSYNLKTQHFRDTHNRYPNSRAELQRFTDRVNSGWNPESHADVKKLFNDETEYEEEFFWNMDLTIDVDVNFELFRQLNWNRIADVLAGFDTKKGCGGFGEDLWIVKDKCGFFKNSNNQGQVQHLLDRLHDVS